MPAVAHTLSTNAAWFEALEGRILSLQALWRPQPFKERRPAWCRDHPELCEALLRLDAPTTASLYDDRQALLAFLGNWIPEFLELSNLIELEAETLPPTRMPKHLDWAIPGRKWQQIRHLLQSLGRPSAPPLEWCGGKGHLGRVLAQQYDLPVTTLERDADLCREGEELARRSGVQQVFRRVDVLSPAVGPLTGHHPVALHACGELHRRLLRHTLEQGLPALDLVPCCYHLGMEHSYRPFSGNHQLQLVRDDLRLAVTGQRTASRRELRQRDREMAWKLGFIGLRQGLQGERVYQNLKPIDKSWLNGSFEDFCRTLAKREGFALPEGIDWSQWEARAWQRQHEVMRLSLPRLAVSRALELWLVLDMAVAMEQQGYTVQLKAFCPSHMSPRNILLSARR